MENQQKREPSGYRMGPRVEVTTRVRPEIHDALRQLAEEKGISMTRLVAGLMEEVVRARAEATASTLVARLTT